MHIFKLSFISLCFLILLPLFAKAEELEVNTIDVYDPKAVIALVESVNNTFARSRVGGTVDGLAIDEGSEVKQGDILAVVVDPKQPLAISAIDSRLESLKHEESLAQIELNRISGLVKTGTASKAALDKAQTKLDVISNNIKSLQAERDLEIQRQSEGQVIAPANGRVLQVFITNGSVVQPGDNIAEIAVEGYILRLSLPERHARFIKKGDEVDIVNRNGESETLIKGKINQVYPKIENGRVTADVVADNLGNFFVGERVTVYVATSKRPSIIIPETFINKKYGISYVTLKGGKEVVVQTGLLRKEGIEILSGLEEGDVIYKP